MQYQIVEDRSVAAQTHEIINLEHTLADAEIKLPEKFLVMSIVDKFPKPWENFGMTLKHQNARLSLDDLIIAISIEEEHRNQTHKMPVEHQPRANLIVGKQKVNKVNSNSKAINKDKATKNKIPKSNNPCWNCGQVVGGSSSASTLGATEGYAIIRRIVSMGNPCTAEVLGIGSVDLKFPSGLLLTSGSLKYLWGEAWNTACHILNRVPLKHNISTPFELRKVFVGRGLEYGLPYSEQSSLKHNISTPSKLRTETSYALRFLAIKSEIPGIEVNAIVKFRDAIFIEDVFPMKIEIHSSVSLDDSLASMSIPEHVEKMTNVGVNPNSTSLTHEESDEPRWSKRARVVKDFGTLASMYNLPIHQMDVKTTFLYGELEEEIYMDQTEGFVAHGNEHKADVILGIKLVRSTDGIAISQSHYVEKIIEKFGYQNSRIAKTPYDSSISLFKNESGVSVSQLRVLRYLKGTMSLVIHYGRFPTVLKGYSDAS
ncbi:Retrovirus-related Pol polyprotein from transposon TNT 1-94 [Sesamum angolense]|uniref:Retrovirus-related Pol polyprotein from transposon TNT 1-94 n=1 Tax=Sesamum angolense TaxID=2727404 RepID=A0AAE1WJI7_9LAMI|nr:Retrovirus-related Pol polyprotein from transposon TNT 1-94 [Sesamum angolense]